MDSIVNALNAAGVSTAAWAWANKAPTGNYAVVKLSGAAGSLEADNEKLAYSAEGEVHLFRRSASMTDFNKVEAVLKAADCAWYLDSTQYEDDTRLLHDSWVFQFARDCDG